MNDYIGRAEFLHQDDDGHAWCVGLLPDRP
jgi:hypothetical protein